MTKISKRDQQRIADAVLWTERQPKGVAGRMRPAASEQMPPMLMVATEDIEHGTVGLCKPSKGVSVANPGNSYDSVEVRNLGPKIWSGSLLPASWRTYEVGAEAGRMVTFGGWSATRISGTASSTITAGSSGSLGNIVALNGYYPYGAAIGHLPTGYSDIEPGRGVSADLVFNSISGQSQWIITAADRNPSTGGGGSTQWYTIDFRSTVSPTPDTSVAPSENKVVDFTNSIESGSVSGLSFDGADLFTLTQAGDYLLAYAAHCDEAAGGSNFYSPGDPTFPNEVRHGAASFYAFDYAASQTLASTAAYVQVNHFNYINSTANGIGRITVPSGGLDFQLKMRHSDPSPSSDNASVRCFHVTMNIIRF